LKTTDFLGLNILWFVINSSLSLFSLKHLLEYYLTGNIILSLLIKLNYDDNLLICVGLLPNCRYGNIADYGLDKGYVFTRKWVNIFIFIFLAKYNYWIK
jgi:hypothetical protein